MKREHHLSRAIDDFAGKLAPRYGPYYVNKILSPVMVTLRDENNRPAGTTYVKDLKDVNDPNKRPVYNEANEGPPDQSESIS